MLKVLIADDEPYIREGLIELVDWESLGFHICATSHDGDNAFDEIVKHRPHVVLIDIRMPGSTGIEVVRRIREQNISCQFIILSGYSDFEYAKESLLLEVYDYLVKPISQEELNIAILNVKKKIIQEQQMNDKLGMYQQFSREKALKNLLTGLPKNEEINICELTYQIAFIKGFVDDVNCLKYQNPWVESMEILRNGEGITLFFKDANSSQVYNFLLKTAHKFQLKIALSEAGVLARHIARSYTEVKALATHLFCFRDTQVLTAKMIPIIENDELDIDELYLAIEFSDQEKRQELVKKIEKYYQARYHLAEQIKGNLINFQSLLFQKLKYHYTNLPLPDTKVMTHQIYQQETLQDILELIVKQWDEIAFNIKKSIDSDDDSIKKIKYYVGRYYHTNLSLKIVSQVLNYNATYLGKKFKLETGESFSKYVDRIRIEKAKIFLCQDNMKVYEVSERVGYCNIDYFYRKFKNHVGQSPKEYQKKVLLEKKLKGSVVVE